MYRYEMHCHTQQTSKCGKTPGAEMAEFYARAGYTGLVITDHFFNGNTTVPKRAPWAERVERFQDGFRAAQERGKELGLDVFWGWEFSHKGTDFLTYGLDAEWLLRYPYCDQLAVSDYCDLVHRSGGWIVQAHPFREAGYIEMIRLLPRHVDAVETINACRSDFCNVLGERYAETFRLRRFAGTDNHVGLRPRVASLDLDFRARSVREIMEAVMRDEYSIHLYSAEENETGLHLEEVFLPENPEDPYFAPKEETK